MRNYDYVYDDYSEAKNERARRNINVFMNTLIDGLENDLNKQYENGLNNSDEMDKYEKFVYKVKNNGLRVFRDSKGKHKIVPIA